MYIENKSAANYAVAKDNSPYFYAGYTTDIKKVFSKLNVDYRDSSIQNKWSDVYGQNAIPVVKGVAEQQKAMPDVKGMGLKDALYLLENMGMKVVVKGRGKIINQSVSPGTPLIKNSTVVIELG
jgi:cell division protein FtsI (penicillin-binding protein 3)